MLDPWASPAKKYSKLGCQVPLTLFPLGRAEFFITLIVYYVKKSSGNKVNANKYPPKIDPFLNDQHGNLSEGRLNDFQVTEELCY